MGANNLDRAEPYLRAAADAGAPAAEVADQSREDHVAAHRPAGRGLDRSTAAVLPENKMRRTVLHRRRAYPARARERGTEGWVDLEFTVAKDGTTRDAVVTAAEPAGIFDRAALDAVKRWRYEPRVVNGAVVEQRVETRLRFRLSE